LAKKFMEKLCRKEGPDNMIKAFRDAMAEEKKTLLGHSFEARLTCSDGSYYSMTLEELLSGANK